MLRFFMNFLTRRYMRVLANGRISGTKKVVSGMPQGSGLSPFCSHFLSSLAVILEKQKAREEGTEEEEQREVELRRRGKSSRTNIQAYLFADDLKVVGSLFQEQDMAKIQA